MLIRDITNMPNISNKLAYKFRGPFRCIARDENNIWLTPIDQPNAKPFCWNADHAKLARIEPKIRKNMTDEAHDLSRDTECTSRNKQGQQKRNKQGFKFPIDQPAKHKHFLRSKVCKDAEPVQNKFDGCAHDQRGM